MKGINRAEKGIKESRLYTESKDKNTPCIFISYQRKDEEFVEKVVDFIKEQSIDVYFDLEDIKLAKQNDPKMVTNAITKGLNESNYMVVVTSENTYKSPWVPFEIGYAYVSMGNNLKMLKHKNQSKVPDYLKVKELMNNFADLRIFLQSIQNSHNISELKTYEEFTDNPLNEYLD